MMNANSLVLSRVPGKTTWENIGETFQQFGEVIHIRYRNGHERGLVKFLNPQDASKAYKYFQENKFLGRKIKIEYYNGTCDMKETPRAPHKLNNIRVKELDDVAAREKEIFETLKTSWDNFCSTVPQSQESLTFDEILQCLDKIPYEMAQPWKHPSFEEEIREMYN